MSRLAEFVGWLHGGRKRQSPTFGITRGLLMDLEKMPPGESMTISSDNGSRFTVMHADDFDHIIGLAGLEAKPVSMSKAE
jgi:hypothetical protein